MIVCSVELVPLVSSRAAEQPPDWSGLMWFRRVPVKGESIVLADDRGKSDWKMVRLDKEMAGRIYMVDDVLWRVASDDDRNPPPPLIRAMHYSQIEPP